MRSLLSLNFQSTSSFTDDTTFTHLPVIVVLLLKHLPFPLQTDLHFFKGWVIFIKVYVLYSLKQISTVVVSLHDIFKWSYVHFCGLPTMNRNWPCVTNQLFPCADAWLPKPGNQKHWLFFLLFLDHSLWWTPAVMDISCDVLMPFKQPFYEAHVEGKLGPWIKANTKLPALQWVPLEVTHYRPSQHWIAVDSVMLPPKNMSISFMPRIVNLFCDLARRNTGC